MRREQGGVEKKKKDDGGGLEKNVKREGGWQQKGTLGVKTGKKMTLRGINPG